MLLYLYWDIVLIPYVLLRMCQTSLRHSNEVMKQLVHENIYSTNLCDCKCVLTILFLLSIITGYGFRMHYKIQSFSMNISIAHLQGDFSGALQIRTQLKRKVFM